MLLRFGVTKGFFLKLHDSNGADLDDMTSLSKVDVSGSYQFDFES